jgi:hypothetical protein
VCYKKSAVLSVGNYNEKSHSLYEDFEFTEIDENGKDNFYIEIQKIKIEDESLITESYVH